MISYDIICFLDNANVVKHLEYWNFNNDIDKISIWNEYIGKEINSFLDIDLDENNGYINWKGMAFRFTKVKNSMGRGYILYMTKGIDDSKIYEKALDCIFEGIQIYDQNGYMLFCNRSSEKIEKTKRSNIIGRHLLDIYDLDESYSTILNTIKKESLL